MVGMAVRPVGERDGAGPRLANQSNRRAHVIRVTADRPIREAEVHAPERTENGSRSFGFGEPFLDGAVAPHFTGGQIAQPNPMSERGVFRDGSAKTDLQIVGMRSKHEQIDWLHNLNRRWYFGAHKSKKWNQVRNRGAHMLAARFFIVGLTATIAVSTTGCKKQEVPPPPQPTAQSPASAPATKRV